MQYTNISQNMTTFEKRGMGGVSLSIMQSFSPSKMRMNIWKIIIGYENCAPIQDQWYVLSFSFPPDTTITRTQLNVNISTSCV